MRSVSAPLRPHGSPRTKRCLSVAECVDVPSPRRGRQGVRDDVIALTARTRPRLPRARARTVLALAERVRRERRAVEGRPTSGSRDRVHVRSCRRRCRTRRGRQPPEFESEFTHGSGHRLDPPGVPAGRRPAGCRAARGVDGARADRIERSRRVHRRRRAGWSPGHDSVARRERGSASARPRFAAPIGPEQESGTWEAAWPILHRDVLTGAIVCQWGRLETRPAADLVNIAATAAAALGPVVDLLRAPPVPPAPRRARSRSSWGRATLSCASVRRSIARRWRPSRS